MDIVLYMNYEDYCHKTGQYSEVDGEEGRIEAYWSMGRVPKNFKEGEKIWIACEGKVRGCVICEEFNPEDLYGETIVWDSDTWELLPYKEQIFLECKPFRGFRYRWWNDKPDKGGEG